MKLTDQLTLADVDPKYKEFVDKFKPKKTTDDCYTPEPVFAAVLDWVVNEYGIDREKIIRPFWPGADYTEIDYPEDYVVVDNPPFSLITKICRDYQNAGVKFFLFSPYLTNLNTNIGGVCHIITDSKITYENGAIVNTCFLTNLDPCLMRTAPELNDAIIKANKTKTDPLPVYQYPGNVVTATRLGYLSRWGIDVRIYPGQCFFIRALDDQRPKGKQLFGAGYLVSDSAAELLEQKEKEAKERKAESVGGDDGPIKVWKLSEREREWIKSLK